MRDSTEQVSAVLADVFQDDDSEEAPNLQSKSDGPAGRLDEAHTRILRELQDRPCLSRCDFEALAYGHGLLPGGAIETLNDAAFDCCGEPLLEGEDQLDINPSALGALLGEGED